MTTTELKRVLINWITEINDITFLKAIETILESKAETEVITLTQEQRAEIIASKKEIEQGLYIEDEILNKEFARWASAK